jgi:stage II sporulation protein P
MRRSRSHRRATKNHKLLLFTLLFWGLTGLTTFAMLNADIAVKGQDLGEEVGKKYLVAAFPVISRSTGSEVRETPDDNGGNNPISEIEQGSNAEVYKDATEAGESTVIDSASNGEPLVLIYHTHATESYQPFSDGNFHIIEEAGTVREVGTVLQKVLESKGVKVIHNKTLHDNPSYSKSYSRSAETAQSILKANPSIKIVIDLHRDAASYTGNKGHRFNVNGKTAAQFCLVVGQGNDNFLELMAFANKVNQKANDLYPGFSRGVIQKEYKYNQYLADNYILLEMGNNQNNIEEAKLSAVLFAEALAEIIAEM